VERAAQSGCFVSISDWDWFCFVEITGISNRGVSISRHRGRGFWQLETKGWMLEEKTVDAGC
jgi:hypothetical protein